MISCPKTRHAVLFVLLFSATAFARQRPRPDTRLFPPRPDSLLLQNAEVTRLHLPHIQTDGELREMIATGELVRLLESEALHVNIPADRAYARPWAVDLITKLAVDYFAASGQRLQANSAVRTVRFQRSLRRWNRNAAPATGPTASVHPTGIAVDLQRRGLTRAQVLWLEWRLFYLAARGLVLVEEETRQPCFHVVTLMPDWLPDVSRTALP